MEALRVGKEEAEKAAAAATAAVAQQPTAPTKSFGPRAHGAGHHAARPH